MATLANDLARPFELGDVNELPVIAADIIYEGAAVGIVSASGNARPLVALDVFAGFALQNADNSAGAAGAVRVRVRKRGSVQLPVTGVVTTTNAGAKVYASDDNAFTLTSTGNSYIGRVLRVVSAGVAVVEFDATAAQVA